MRVQSLKPFNLAEARILERNYCQAQMTKYLRNIACLIVVTVMIAGGSMTCKTLFAGQLRETKSRLVVVQDRSLRAKRQMQAANTKISEIKWQSQLASGTKHWLQVLDSALGAMPSEVWLDSIKNSDKDSTLAIAGRASSFDGVTSLVASLKSRSEFKEVRLESVKAESDNVVSFALMVTLKRAESTDDSTNGSDHREPDSGSVPDAAGASR